MQRLLSFLFLIALLLPRPLSAQPCTAEGMAGRVEELLNEARHFWPKGEVQLLGVLRDGDGFRQLTQPQYQQLEAFAAKGLIVIQVIEKPLGSTGAVDLRQFHGAVVSGVVGRSRVSPGTVRSDPTFLDDAEWFSVTVGSFRVERIVQVDELRIGADRYCVPQFLFAAGWKSILVEHFAAIEGGMPSSHRKGRMALKYDPFASKWVQVAGDYTNASRIEFPTNSVGNALQRAGAASTPMPQREEPAKPPTPPDYIVQRAACRGDDCRFPDRWRAQRRVATYLTPPDKIGTPKASLSSGPTIEAGTWVIALDGTLLAARGAGTIKVASGRTRGGVALPASMARASGDITIPIYSYLGHGCWHCWIDGQFVNLCEVLPTTRGEEEWWIKVGLQGDTEAWVEFNVDDFKTQLALNSDLATKISSSSPVQLQQRLFEIDALLQIGADPNGGGGKHGATPLQAAIGSGDTDLVRALVLRGLDLRAPNICLPDYAQWSALRPGGDVMLEFLFQQGMSLGCLQQPALISFLSFGIAQPDYSVDRAIRVAQILVNHGAVVMQRDPRGLTILDVLDRAKDPARLTPLRSFLSKLVGPGTSPPPGSESLLRVIASGRWAIGASSLCSRSPDQTYRAELAGKELVWHHPNLRSSVERIENDLPREAETTTVMSGRPGTTNVDVGAKWRYELVSEGTIRVTRIGRQHFTIVRCSG